MTVGIEAINIYGGLAFIDVNQLAGYRNLDTTRLNKLLMKHKTVSMNFEDPVSFAINAAKPILNKFSPQEINQIELLIVATESGLDFGNPISTYVHDYLGLSKNCRNFEIKHACYGGTAALQMAANLIYSNPGQEKKALVITTDVARILSRQELTDEEWQLYIYGEPSQGAAATAILVSEVSKILELEKGYNGYYCFEVMDAYRPSTRHELANPDLSLMSYLDCLENAYNDYCSKAGKISFENYFDYLAFHTPFGGMVKGAHRNLMRKLHHSSPDFIEQDFEKRMQISLNICQEVGNVYSGSLFVALCGVIEKGSFETAKRIGLFSYGSGCCSEFFSAQILPTAQSEYKTMGIKERLNKRQVLSINEYEQLTHSNRETAFGIKDTEIDFALFFDILKATAEHYDILVLKEIKNYHRSYTWV